MSVFVSLVQSNGQPFAVTPESVSYVRQHPRISGRSFVGSFAQRGEPIEVLDDATTVAGLLSAATGVVVPGYPQAPFVELQFAGQPIGQVIFVQGSAVAFVRADPRDALACFVQTNSQGVTEGPWRVVGDVATVSAALATASGSGGGPGPMVGPVWRWPAGSGSFGAQVAFGWDVSAMTWGTSIQPDFFGGEAIEAAGGESTGAAIAVQWFPAPMPFDFAALLAQAHSSANFQLISPALGELCAGLVIGDPKKDCGLLYGLKLANGGALSTAVARWDGSNVISNQFEAVLDPAYGAPGVGAYMALDGGSVLDPGNAPKAAGGIAQAWTLGNVREAAMATGLFAPLAPVWNGAEPFAMGLAVWSQVAVPAGASAQWWDFGLWHRFEGGTVAPAIP